MQTSSGDDPASYPMGTGVLSLGQSNWLHSGSLNIYHQG